MGGQFDHFRGLMARCIFLSLLALTCMDAFQLPAAMRTTSPISSAVLAPASPNAPMMLFGGAKKAPTKGKAVKKVAFVSRFRAHVPTSLSILPLHFCLSRHCKNVGRQGSKKRVHRRRVVVS